GLSRVSRKRSLALAFATHVRAWSDFGACLRTVSNDRTNAATEGPDFIWRAQVSPKGGIPMTHPRPDQIRQKYLHQRQGDSGAPAEVRRRLRESPPCPAGFSLSGAIARLEQVMTWLFDATGRCQQPIESPFDQAHARWWH